MLNQEILFNVLNQTFFYDPPEGRPSGTPTVQVFLCTVDDDGAAETATTGACSVDSVSTTFSASAGASQITVASGTGITRGQRYLLIDAAGDGDREWAEVVSVVSTTVNLRQPLRNTYAASSTFQGCRISIGVNATWVADKGKISDVLDPTGRAWLTSHLALGWIAGAGGYRLRWSYTVDGTATLGVSFADLVRYQAKNLVTPLSVDRRIPGWIDRLPTDYQEDQGAALIEEAFQAMRMDCLGDEQLVRRIRNTEVLRELVIHRANILAHEASVLGGGGSTDALKLANELYQRRYDQLIREPKVPIDQIGAGSSMDPVRMPISRR